MPNHLSFQKPDLFINLRLKTPVLKKTFLTLMSPNQKCESPCLCETLDRVLSGTIIRGTLKTPNSQLVTPISIKLQRPDGYD
jgi:hypothetical protein